MEVFRTYDGKDNCETRIEDFGNYFMAEARTAVRLVAEINVLASLFSMGGLNLRKSISFTKMTTRRTATTTTTSI